MSQFEIHEIEDAPEAARPLLEGVQAKTGGFLPNLYKGLAEAPQALNAYLTLSDLLAKTSLSAQEQQVVLLAASIENNCHYCVAAHSSGARMAKVDKEEIALLRRGEPVGEPRLQALRLFTEAVVRERGHPGRFSRGRLYTRTSVGGCHGGCDENAVKLCESYNRYAT